MGGRHDLSLSHSLMDAIERDGVDLEGVRYPLHVVDVRPNPQPPLEPIAVKVTVQTERDGEPHRVTCNISLDNIDRDDYVLAFVKGAMRQVLTGELPPDTMDYA